MTTAESQAANGAVDDADAAPRLVRDIVYEAVSELEADGMPRADAIKRVAADRGMTVSNVSGGYYTARKRRLAQVTEGDDPHDAIMVALASVEEALAEAKVVIASATMQYERLRADAAKYAEVRKLIK